MTEAIFEIGGASPVQPTSVVYDEPVNLGRRHSGGRVKGYYTALTLTFGALSESDYATWRAYDDGESKNGMIMNPNSKTAASSASFFVEITSPGTQGPGDHLWDGLEVRITHVVAS
jgi:hypothetical protein